MLDDIITRRECVSSNIVVVQNGFSTHRLQQVFDKFHGKVPFHHNYYYCN